MNLDFNRQTAPRVWRVTRMLWLLALCCVHVGEARAQTAQPPAAAQRDTAAAAPSSKPPRPGVGPALVALGPGLLIHGAGAWTARDPESGRELALAGGAGFAALLAGSAVLATTGTSRKLVGPAGSLALVGYGVFMLGWLGDVYAAASGARDVHAVTRPALTLELGYRYIRESQFDYAHFSFLEADWASRHFRVRPSAWIAMDDDNQRLRGELTYRAKGRFDRPRASDASALDLVSAVTLHRVPDAHFDVWTYEAELRGRLDGSRLSRGLAGSFMEASLGYGLSVYDYDLGNVTPARDLSGLLLGRYAFGVYLQGDAPKGGELSVYYSHRHDDYVGGLGVRGIPAGILGYFGLDGHYVVRPRWAVTWMVALGASHVFGAGVRYRVGEAP